jgi:hypothetical protein
MYVHGMRRDIKDARDLFCREPIFNHAVDKALPHRQMVKIDDVFSIAFPYSPTDFAN